MRYATDVPQDQWSIGHYERSIQSALVYMRDHEMKAQYGPAADYAVTARHYMAWLRKVYPDIADTLIDRLLADINATEDEIDLILECGGYYVPARQT